MRSLATLVSMVLLLTGAAAAENWPHWRGPSRDGASREVGLPVSWGAKCAAASPAAAQRVAPQPQRGFGGFGGQGRPLVPLACDEFVESNISWKLRLPAYSGSTPIIWGDMIFLNMATEANRGELELWAVDRRTKAVAWKRNIANTNHMENKQNMSTP